MRKPGNPHRQKKGRGRALTLEQLWWKHQGRCKYCGMTTVLGGNGPNQATRDHVRAKARGGKQSGNLALACAECNLTKGAKSARRSFGQCNHDLPRRCGPGVHSALRCPECATRHQDAAVVLWAQQGTAPSVVRGGGGGEPTSRSGWRARVPSPMDSPSWVGERVRHHLLLPRRATRNAGRAG